LSQWSHTVSRTPCHVPWTSAPLSAHPSIECECTASQIETLICTRRTTTHHIHLTTTKVQHSGRMTNGMRGGPTTPQDSAFSSPTPAPVPLPRRAWVRLNRLRTGVGRFRSCLHKWSMASSAACECGAEEQTVDHIVIQCPIHRPPHGLHGLTVLDDETTEWLLNIFPEV